MRRPLLILALAVALAAPHAPSQVAAQAPGASPAPSFDVASVRRNTSGSNQVAMGLMPGGQLRITNMPLRPIIVRAYEVLPQQIVGGPDWIDTARFDINAKAGTDVPPSEINLMLRSLLEERFRLTTRRETREMPIYSLVLARSDGRLGPRLTRSEIDCAARMAAARGGGAPPLPPPPPGPPQPGELRPCQMMMSPGRLTGSGLTISPALTNLLSQRTGRVVVDRTGLTGAWNFDLEFAPEPVAGMPGFGGPVVGGPPIASPANPDAPTLVTALQEQLGLKLEAGRAPVDVIVIEHVEQPVDD